MVAAFSVGASIAALDNNGQCRVCDFCAGSYGKSSAVEAVEDICVQIVRGFGCLSDA